MVLNYIGKKFSEEDVLERVNLAKIEETDPNARQLIMNLSRTKLSVLNSLNEDIQQICDCFFLKKHMAALTLSLEIRIHMDQITGTSKVQQLYSTSGNMETQIFKNAKYR